MEPEGILMSIFRYFYKKRKATPLEQDKPKFKWLPKYFVPLQLPENITLNNMPNEALEKLLLHFGFTFKYATKNHLYFSRGKSWGDFSIKLIRINLIFDNNLNENTTMNVELADACLFDTGDLWALSTEISNYFSECLQAEKLKMNKIA